MKRMLSTLVLVSLLIASPALANNGSFAVGGNVGYATLTGDDFQNSDPGFGFDGFARYFYENGFAFGAGFAWNSHGITDTSDSVNMIAISFDPRYYWNNVHHMVAPFFGVEAAWMQQSNSTDAGDMSANGWGFGAAGGALFQVNEHFGIETSIHYRALSFGDADVDGTTVADSSTSGGSFSFNTGFVIGF